MIDHPRSRSKMRQNARLNTSKTQSYQGFSSFIKYKMSVKGEDTHFKCRDSVLTVSIQGLQRVRASVLTVSNQFSCIDC